MDVKHVIVGIAVLGLVVLVGRRWRQLGLPFALALIVSLAWTTYYRYEYVGSNIFLANRINVYPLALWTAGLTMLYVGYTSTPVRHRYLVAIGIYYATLAILEFFGYYVLNVRLNSNYTSLLNLGVIHAPLVMKTFYLVAGPLYLLLLRRRESPQ